MQPSIVVTADQQNSRRGTDRVPAALARLAAVPVRLGFERTAGDEIQALVATPAAAVEVVSALTREGDWRIGIGLGSVAEPLPASTREARGSAYLAARDAVIAAGTAPTSLALRSDGAARYPAEQVMDAEAALWLLRTVLSRRTQEGWQIVDLIEQGLTGGQSALRLGISASAASQRLRRSAHEEVRGGVRLATRLLARATAGAP